MRSSIRQGARRFAFPHPNAGWAPKRRPRHRQTSLRLPSPRRRSFMLRRARLRSDASDSSSSRLPRCSPSPSESWRSSPCNARSLGPQSRPSRPDDHAQHSRRPASEPSPPVPAKVEDEARVAVDRKLKSAPRLWPPEGGRELLLFVARKRVDEVASHPPLPQAVGPRRFDGTRRTRSTLRVVKARVDPCPLGHRIDEYLVVERRDVEGVGELRQPDAEAQGRYVLSCSPKTTTRPPVEIGSMSWLKLFGVAPGRRTLR
jgi:hypothetical protein